MRFLRMVLAAAGMLAALLVARPARAQCDLCASVVGTCCVNGCVQAPFCVFDSFRPKRAEPAPGDTGPAVDMAPSSVLGLASSGAADERGAFMQNTLYNLTDEPQLAQELTFRYRCGNGRREERGVATAVHLPAAGSVSMPAHQGVCRASRGEVLGVTLLARMGTTRVTAEAQVHVLAAPPPRAPQDDDGQDDPTPGAGGAGVMPVLRMSPPRPRVQRY